MVREEPENEKKSAENEPHIKVQENQDLIEECNE